MWEAYWLNLGSLIFGLAAWILPVVRLAKRDKADRRKGPLLSALSFGACAVSLCMQILYNDHLVKIEDWSALLDTSHAVASVSCLLLAGTILGNAVSWILTSRGKPADKA
jgi:cytochrome c oxidase subunit 4